MTTNSVDTTSVQFPKSDRLQHAINNHGDEL
jgi:hypothetical protein